MLPFQSVLFNKTVILVIRKPLRKAIYGFLVLKFCFPKISDTSWRANEFPLNFNFFHLVTLLVTYARCWKKLRKWKSCKEYKVHVSIVYQCTKRAFHGRQIQFCWNKAGKKEKEFNSAGLKVLLENNKYISTNIYGVVGLCTKSLRCKPGPS